jgi:hypothetical protein
MPTIATCQTRGKKSFNAVAEPFLQGEALPFARVLSAEAIQRAFAENDALFAQGEVFSTQLVLWAFLAQTLRDGKGAACASAVADIATYMQQIGGHVPSGDTGDYCRARAKLDLAALRRLVGDSARQLDGQAEEDWLWHGRHAKLVDGYRWNPELDTRAIKQTLHLDDVRCGPRQAAAPVGLHVGVPDDSVLVDAAVDGLLPGCTGPVAWGVGADRRQRGRQPSRPH